MRSLDPALPGLDPFLARHPAGLPAGWKRVTATWHPGDRAVLTFRHEQTQAVLRVDVTADGVEQRAPIEDRALPGLALVLDRNPSARVVSYKPGASCVVSTDSDTLHKVFPPCALDRVVSGWRALARVGGHRHVPRIPEVLDVEPAAGVLVMAHVDGVPLRRHADDPGYSIADRTMMFHRLGSGLAALAREDDLGLPPAGLGDDVREASVGLQAMRSIDPVSARRVAEVLEALDSAGTALDPRMGPAHGALRTDQVLVGSSLALVDLDGACEAAPERDAANLAAYLWWRGVRQPGVAGEMASQQRAVWAGLVDGGAEPDPARFVLHRAASLLKIATRRYRSLAVSEWPLVPHLVDEAARSVVP